jgi:hypothetical protein
MDSTAICNLALAKVGDIAILSLDDPTPEARFCKLFYEQTINELLRLHQWNWATTFARLSQTTPSPDIAWQYAYLLPVDYGRIITFNAFSSAMPRPTYQLGTGVLYTDESVAEISYVREITNSDEFDPMFVELIALKVGARLARPLAGSLDIEKTLLGEFSKSLNEARRIDASDNFMPRKQAWVESDLVRARWSEVI